MYHLRVPSAGNVTSKEPQPLPLQSLQPGWKSINQIITGIIINCDQLEVLCRWRHSTEVNRGSWRPEAAVCQIRREVYELGEMRDLCRGRCVPVPGPAPQQRPAVACSSLAECVLRLRKLLPPNRDTLLPCPIQTLLLPCSAPHLSSPGRSITIPSKHHIVNVYTGLLVLKSRYFEKCYNPLISLLCKYHLAFETVSYIF